MYYASIGVLSLLVHIIINIEALKKPQNTSTKITRNRYRMFLYGVMIFYISDILWGYLYDRKMILMLYIDTVIFFASMVLSVLFWTRFVVSYLDNKGRFSRILLISGWIILLYEFIALVVNLFIPVVFGFDKDNEYAPGQARYITLFIQMFLFLMTSIYTLYVSFKVTGDDRAHHLTIGVSGIIMTVFIAMQSFFPLMPFYSIGCLLATCMIHSFVYRDMTVEYQRELEKEKEAAYKDPLTGVKNKLAYMDAMTDIESRVQNGELTEYGIIVFDLNGLKEINDTFGHDEGDEYIKSACKLICQRFKHSPVFRIGGDEFVTILEGEDYEDRTSLMKSFNQVIRANKRAGLVVIASGGASYNPNTDTGYNDVFKRADKKMYRRKEQLKTI